MAKYSLLIAGDPWGNDTEETIKNYLCEGIKVFWFTDAERLEVLQKDRRFIDFFNSKAGFVRFYSNAAKIQCVIEDGKDFSGEVLIDGKTKSATVKEILDELEKNDNSFNLEQYEVEHLDKDLNVIVRAGAGTGKTHVMIDRIMYLLHMDDEFDLSQLAMITFTNKATDEMRHRLMETLNDRFRLTRNMKYLEYVEDVASANISTIHSFFRRIIQEAGPILGYGTDFRLKSFSQEREDILKELLGGYYNGKREKDPDPEVKALLGLEPYKILKLARSFWDSLGNKGYSDEEIKAFDWGKDIENDETAKLQDSLIVLLSKVEEEYEKIKISENAISMKDIIHELDKARSKSEGQFKDYITSHYKYLFCDEFQDTDSVQIETIVELNRLFESRFFVVGDVKQGIYRFRGATSTAFKYLEAQLDQEEKDHLKDDVSLNKNYRTSKDILDDKLHDIFLSWGEAGLLEYDNEKDRLYAQNTEEGRCEFESEKCFEDTEENEEDRDVNEEDRDVNEEDGDENEEVSDVKHWFKEKIKEITDNSTHKEIVCLTRTNDQLSRINGWCKEMDIPCLIQRRGTFYRSDAVLDFCAMIEGCLYEREPMYLYNLLISSYVGKEPKYKDLISCNGDEATIRKLLKEDLGEVWEGYCNSFKTKPVMAVIRQIVTETEPIKNYFIIRKKELEKELEKEPEKKQNISDDTLNEQVVIDTKQYEADLNKLIRLLTDKFSGEFVSLYDICSFVRIMIETDDKEDQEIIEQTDKNVFYVKGMTAHSSKGLQFENVLIPFMGTPFENIYRSDILISDDKKDVGWIYRNGKRESKKNNNYDELYDKEMLEIKRDETRLLYVAMTRARYGLFCYDPGEKKPLQEAEKWADLIGERENSDEKGL